MNCAHQSEVRTSEEGFTNQSELRTDMRGCVKKVACRRETVESAPASKWRPRASIKGEHL